MQRRKLILSFCVAGAAALTSAFAGAGGSIGTGALAQAKPDGYTLGIATVSTHGINPVVYKSLPFDARKDFTPITNIAAVPNVMVLNTLDRNAKIAEEANIKLD